MYQQVTLPQNQIQRTSIRAFFSGIFVNCKDVISDYRSNAEAGLGYLDFAFKDDPGKTAVVIEIKSCTSTDELLNAHKVALEQIKEKKYAESYIKDSSIDHVYAYAIAFLINTAE